ncbi:MAG: DUF4097 family beta strand repeat protein [candidate division Zixibacteria bacterium]|nr:DUF4097 family beta strand repeat protein [candidate division Zixibacteria bacterium]
MRRIAFLLLAPFLLFASATPAGAEKISKDFHKSFDVKEGVTLHVKHGDGDVTITPWDKDVVDVEVRYRAEVKSVGIGGKLYFDVEFRQTKDAIYVTGKERSSGSIGFRSVKKYEHIYSIRAPMYVELDLEGEDGDVTIERWQGKIYCDLEDGDVELESISSPSTQIRLEDGDVRIDGLQGDLSVRGEDGDVAIMDSRSKQCRIDLEDGDITITNSEGDFEIAASDGDVTLNQVRASMLDISVEDGDIEVDLLRVDNIDVDITADDGNVKVGLEQGMSAAFSIDTDEGRIRTDLPDANFSGKKRHRVSGEMHGGDGRLRIRTLDGNVVLRESD